MSYILDALKKAERERRRTQVPTIATVHEFDERPPSRPWMIGAVAIFSVAAVVILLLIFFRLNDRAHPAAQIVTQPKSQQHMPEPELPEKGEFPAIRSMELPPAAVEVKPKVEVSRNKTSDRETKTELEKKEPPSPPAIEASGPVSRPETTEAAPVSLREVAAKMRLSILMYSENPAERLVFINGVKYLEGDYVEDLYLLESITSEGALLSHGDERVLLRPGSK